MFGLIAKMTAVEGKRDELISLLVNGTANMPGCLSYIVSKDVTDKNVIWITEAWEGKAHHEASLQLPTVQEAIAKGRPLIVGMEMIASTEPVGGEGL